MKTLLVLLSLFAVPALAGGKLALESKDLKANGTLPDKHVFNGMGCTGENISPELSWKNAPEGTKSFALSVYDPDAPTGSGWWHWVVYNIPATATGLPQGAGSGKGELPAGTVQGNTDFGQPGYGGACPPPGDKPHHYIFTLTALKVEKLDVPANATAAYVGFATHANELASATLKATYGRKK